MDRALAQTSSDFATSKAQQALLAQNQQMLQAAELAHRQALVAAASRSPFGRDMLRHLNAGKTVEQAFGLAATHFAKLNARRGLGPVLNHISQYASNFGFRFPKQKLLMLRKNVEFIVAREREAGRQLN